jgi:hypothetical protein
LFFPNKNCRVKLTFEVDDDTGSGLFRAFDNVMISVAAVKSSSKVGNIFDRDFFPYCHCT